MGSGNNKALPVSSVYPDENILKEVPGGSQIPMIIRNLSIKLTFSAMCSLFCLSLHAQYLVKGDTIEFDTITFENQRDYLRIDTSARNIWVIGTPAKEFLNAAYSGGKGIITDSAGYYPAENHSFFELVLVEGEEPFDVDYYSFGIEFRHRYDTDTLRDGGYITISYDNGHTWTNIIHDTLGPYCLTPSPWVGKNLYSCADSLATGENGFSGRSDGWVTTSFDWRMCMVKNTSIFDTTILRFNFVSDSIDHSKEGWLIDDIRLFSIFLGSNARPDSPDSPLRLFPNPARDEVMVHAATPMTRIELFNTRGQMVKRCHPQSETTNLDLGGLDEGTYFVSAFIDEMLIGILKMQIVK